MQIDQGHLATRFRRELRTKWSPADERHAPVKIFGERNSGTNLATALVAANTSHALLPGKYSDLVRLHPSLLSHRSLESTPQLREIVIDLTFQAFPATRGWKHSSPAALSDRYLEGVVIIFLVRHPISWLASLHRNPYHLRPKVPRDFTTFLRTRFKTLGRERLGRAALTPHEIWLRKLEAYVHVAERMYDSENTPRFSLFENLVTGQEAEFRSWKLRLRGGSQIHEINKSQKGSHFLSSDYANYYQNELWRRELGKDNMREATKLFSPDLLDIWSPV